MVEREHTYESELIGRGADFTFIHDTSDGTPRTVTAQLNGYRFDPEIGRLVVEFIPGGHEYPVRVPLSELQDATLVAMHKRADFEAVLPRKKGSKKYVKGWVIDGTEITDTGIVVVCSRTENHFGLSRRKIKNVQLADFLKHNAPIEHRNN